MSDLLAPGVTVGSHELVRLLGEGGQGRVYEAIRRGPGGRDRRVAVKIVDDRASLRREARLGSLLRHPNLVDVFEVGEQDGLGFLAMEYCEGGSLAAWIPLPPRAVLEVGLQVCAALSYAHGELGLVHLDLKPENLLLDGPVVKVADLGIAAVPGERRSARGTRGYAAPEQESGGPVDARTDLFALGAVLRVLARGRGTRAWEETFSLDPAPDGGDAPSPEVVATEADAQDPLAPVIDRCLAFDPDDRFATMADLAAALRALPDVPGPGLAAFLGVSGPAGSGGPGTNVHEDDGALVGREAELSTLAHELARPGIVTLKGPPGIGKSALAREAARRYHTTTGLETRLVDLVEARSRLELVGWVARVMEVPPARGTDEAALTDQVGHALAARGDSLLVLDHLEHPAEFAAVVERWRALAPRARLLVTSRAPLHLPDEGVLEVSALEVQSAMALVRACALRRGVVLADDDPAVRELALRLDGLPLAIELAVGRVGVLSLGDVLQRLSLSLLRSGRAGASEREATLTGALGGSHALLDAPSRAALAQLSVFRGGFSARAACAVLDLGLPGAPVLADLVERSWIVRRGERLALLEPVREFAASQLSDDGAATRHAAWFAAWGTDAALAGVTRAIERRLYRADLANLAEAARNAAHRGDLALATDALAAVWSVVSVEGPAALAAELAGAVLAIGPDLPRARWVAAGAAWLSGRFDEALDHAAAARAHATDPGLRSRVLELVGEIRLARGRLPDALEALGEARADALTAGDRAGEGRIACQVARVHLEAGQIEAARASFAEALVLARGRPADAAAAEGGLAMTDRIQGRMDEARAHFESALAAHRELGARTQEAGTLVNLAVLHQHQGRPLEARAHYEAGIRLHGEVGNRRGAAIATFNLGSLDQELGELDAAAARYAESVPIFRELGMRSALGTGLTNLAHVAKERGEFGEAERLYREGLALCRETGERRGEAITGFNLANLVHHQQRREEARALYLEALAIVRELGDLRLEGTVHGALGILARAAAAPAEAEAHLREALRLLAQVGDRLRLARAQGDLARVLAVPASADAARALVAAGVATARELSAGRDLIELLCAQARVEHGLGDLDRARDALAEAEALAAPSRSPFMVAGELADVRALVGSGTDPVRSPDAVSAGVGRARPPSR